MINIHVLLIFFQTRIPFIKTYKNPCWYDKPNHLSCLPYFIILGVQKCGTTDLFASFVHHPDFRPSLCKDGNVCKELHFFDSEYYYTKTGKYMFKYRVPPPPFPGGVCVPHLFSFLCCYFCFVCLHPVSCLPNVASVSELFILDFPFGFL